MDQRPFVVEQRARIGDWEGDLIMGRSNRSAIGTPVDRRTGYLRGPAAACGP
jgi:IS30 family transposase